MTENENERFQELTRRIAETGLFSLSEIKYPSSFYASIRKHYFLKDHDIELVLSCTKNGEIILWWASRIPGTYLGDDILSSVDEEMRTELLFHLDLIREIEWIF